MKVGRVSLGFLVLTFTPYLPAFAEERNALFEKNSARDIFSEDIYLTGDGGIDYLRPPKPDESFDVREPEQKMADQAIKDPRTVPGTPEDLIQSFGNPFEVYPVLAQDSAPKPFKGMMAALEMGQEDLAMAYARQYWNYMDRLGGRSAQVATMMEQINADEAKKAQHQAAPEETDKKDKSELALAHEGEKPTLKTKADDILERARQLETDAKNGDTSSLTGNSSSSAVEKDLAARVPVAPDGIVDIYFFFRPEEKVALLMSSEVQELYERTKDDPKVKFMGFTIEKTGSEALENFRERTGATFPIADGSQLALKLKSIRSPSTVFIARTSGKIFTEEGPRNEVQLVKVLKLMQGGK